MSFEEMGLMPELVQGVMDLDWILPTPIQAESVPLILRGGSTPPPPRPAPEGMFFSRSMLTLNTLFV